ncbi:MAG TPA: thioredoxin domain-containing protein, partial [Deltaproteobacteria bacterium]|nr:thioredoxin domain-containing protein [Deltaproteobacteria bacterium]
RHEVLVDRSKSFLDGSLPSGNAVAAEVLLRLGRFTGSGRYTEAAQKTLESHGYPMEKQPFGTAAMINVLEDQLEAPREIVIVGERDETRDLRLAAFAHSQPGEVVIVARQEKTEGEPVEILRGKLSEAPVAYVCQNQTCSAPIAQAETLEELLRGSS